MFKKNARVRCIDPLLKDRFGRIGTVLEDAKSTLSSVLVQFDHMLAAYWITYNQLEYATQMEKTLENAYDSPPPKAPTQKLTGGSSDYYKVTITNPTTECALPYTAECNDIIEALSMNYAEGNAFKALWRIAAARKGNGKPGTTALYDSEKVEFFGKRLVKQNKGNK